MGVEQFVEQVELEVEELYVGDLLLERGEQREREESGMDSLEAEGRNSLVANKFLEFCG